MKIRKCKECPPDSKRPAPHPGPRCATHHRAARKARSAASHARRVESTYGITAEQYAALYEAQGGVCFICRRATGKTRRLSVDHCHATGEVRALLCRPCNDLLGHVRDDIETLRRAAIVLRDHPAQEVLLRMD